MDVITVLDIIEAVVLIIITIGGVIFGTIKLIQSKSSNAKTEAIEQTNKDIEAIKKEHDTELNEIHVEMNEITQRLDELDNWRKDMNGQLKLINERQKFTNQILEEQKNNLVLVTHSLQTVSTNLAVLNESVKLSSHLKN
jgi:chromosome segregation ATPase